MKRNNGFTLIELMIVIAIIGTMVSYSIPSYHQYTIKSQVKESYLFAQQLQKTIADFYQKQLRFPKNNQEAGLPPANKLLSNHISAINIEDGAMHLTLGQKINQVAQGKVLSIQPMVVNGSPKSPISWACGQAKSPNGLSKIGSNKTTLETYYLPIECRI